jgi:hypothetical protein
MPRLHILSTILPLTTGIVLFAIPAQAATTAQKHAIHHLAAMHAGAYGPPTAIRANNTTPTMTVVFTLPDKSRRLFFVRPNGRVEAMRYRPVVGGDAAAPAPASPAPPSPPSTPEGGGYGGEEGCACE